jgi:hypothetical protein
MRAWDEGLGFRDLVRGDAEIATRVELDEVLDIEAFTRNSDVVFTRLRGLVSEKEEVRA